MFLNKLSLRSKLLFFTILNILFIWLLGIVSIDYIARKTLENQFLRDSETISKNTSMNIQDYLLTQDYDSLSLVIKNILKNEDILYVVVTDNKGNVLISNFSESFPQDLLRLIHSIPPEQRVNYRIVTEKGMGYHISAPVLEGKIGSLHIGFSINNIKKAINKLNIYLFIAGLFMLVIGALVSVAYSTYLSKPFRELIRATDEVKRGNLNVKIKYKGNDEIARLSQAFNMMTDGIKENIKLLESAYRRSNQEDKVSAVRDLIKGVAEEINNPLTGIKHLIEIIIHSDSLEQERLKGYMQKIDEGLNRINMVMQTLIKYTGEIAYTIQEYNLQELIENVLKIVSEDAEWKRLRILTQIKAHNLIIMGNGTYLTYAFANILKNFKHSYREYNLLEITAREEPEGVGIEFSGRMNNQNKKTISHDNDTDLAFNISCRIIEIHGGSVSLYHEDDKTRIYVRLPLRGKR